MGYTAKRMNIAEKNMHLFLKLPLVKKQFGLITIGRYSIEI